MSNLICGKAAVGGNDNLTHDNMGTDKANEADCLAIKYDEKGEPQKLVFVEIKSLKGSLSGTSSLSKHMENMDKYITKHLDYMKLRKKEAQDILNLYCLLGLRGVTEEVCNRDYSKLALFGNQEVVLVFTDDAQEYICSEGGKKWIDGKLAGYPSVEGAYGLVRVGGRDS